MEGENLVAVASIVSKPLSLNRGDPGSLDSGESELIPGRIFKYSS